MIVQATYQNSGLLPHCTLELVLVFPSQEQSLPSRLRIGLNQVSCPCVALQMFPARPLARVLLGTLLQVSSQNKIRNPLSALMCICASIKHFRTLIWERLLNIVKTRVVNCLKLDGVAVTVACLPHGNSILLQNPHLYYYSILKAHNLEPIFLTLKSSF